MASPHRRQYLIGPASEPPVSGWRGEELAPGVHLSHCPELPVKRLRHRDGSACWLIGLAVQTDPSRPAPEQQLAASEPGDAMRLCDDWGGRWALLSGGLLWTDAGGVLGCLYRQTGGRLWISSSPALLSQLPGRPPLRPATAALVDGRGMDWFPPPQTRSPGLRRLMPSQALEISDPADPIRPRPLPDPARHAASYPELLDRIQQRLVTAVRNAGALGLPVWVPLTGGGDSRLLLACSLYAGIDVRTYTFLRPGIAPPDRDLPARLAGAVGVEHRAIAPGRRSRRAERAFDRHAGGQTIGPDRRYVAHGQWDALPAPALVLRGHVVCMGRPTYHDVLPASPPQSESRLVDAVVRGFALDTLLPDSPVHRPSLAEWAEWAMRTHQPALDWRDRFYIEQRLAGWLGAIEQALDVTGRERMFVGSCGELIAMLVAIPPSVRHERRYYADLIGRLAPALLDLPMNPRFEAPPSSLGTRARRGIGRRARAAHRRALSRPRPDR